MQKFDVLTGVAAPLLRANVDTDAIIPSREMKTVSKSGLADGLFAGWRYAAHRQPRAEPGFRAQPARLRRRAGAARGRELRLRVEPRARGVGARRVRHPSRDRAELRADLPRQLRAQRDPASDPRRREHRAARRMPWPPTRSTFASPWISHRQRVSGPGDLEFAFELDPESREMLLEGLDAIDLTLKHRDAIESFHARDRAQRPWIYLQRTSTCWSAKWVRATGCRASRR